ncbi:L-carnitine dehydratase/bile acid-inducible protein F [Nostocoides japonicum T1-X7]|uniref:L-carnitine dehydratase/bile acid-inducible protein F n=1 Tax=Nostocoides japonicum T1-X7 TaxID=1194083 RepID=A0A077M4X1_9MICO|nr:CoA transferase [Tetrasphaera japonica]CCH79150.1 L-carnitine dehydratase/bile acid-inducible protein F [Tetrasphaera japonica T1-X7]
MTTGTHPSRPLPLDGVRILSLEQYGAGPFGTSHLADLGAEVIKIEDPRAGGDVGRYVPPFAQGEDSLFFEGLNRGKKSISLDLTSPAGRAVFEQLVAVSHAVYSNMRGDVPAKIGITYDDLKHLNPAIVCCSLSGFGTSGPRHAEPGYDYIIQGLTGWMDVTGEPDGPPTKSGLSVVDWSTGFVAALALLAGLRAADRDGIGMDCDVSLYDTAVSMLSYPGVWHLNAGFEPARTRHSAHPSIVPFQAFQASDGWFIVGAAKEKFWVRVAEVVGRPDLATDPQFATMAARQVHSEQLVAILEQIFAGDTVAHWVQALRAAGVPTGEVNSVADALTDPHIHARGLIVEAEHPVYGTVKSLASPVRVGGTFAPARRAPQRGEHTRELLATLTGMDETALSDAAARGAFGPALTTTP